MAVDQDAIDLFQPQIDTLTQELDVLRTRIAALEVNGTGSNADPLLDAYTELSDAVNDVQDGLTREQKVQKLLDISNLVRTS